LSSPFQAILLFTIGIGIRDSGAWARDSRLPSGFPWISSTVPD